MEAEPLKVEPKRKRRRFQFRLRTLMIAVTLFCVVGAWFGNQAWIVIQRKAILRDDKISGMMVSDDRGLVPDRPNIPWIRRILGDRDCFVIWANESASDEDMERYKAAFPEAGMIRAPR